MQSKHKPALTIGEKAHVAKVARLPCAVCGTYGDIEVHEPEQGMWFISIPLCTACHRGPQGWHGDRLRWKLQKMTELKAINETARMLET